MKRFLLGLVLGILLASVPLAYTQQRSERIFVGNISLQLGTEKDADISKLAEGGFKLAKLPSSESQSESWIVEQKNEKTAEYDILGSLHFTNGRLLSASRHWAESWDTGSAKVGKNFYFLIKSFEEAGNTSCSIETQSEESPDYDSKKTLIHCGRRMVTVDVTKYKEQPEETQVTETVK
jgi:hypothetical protein